MGAPADGYGAESGLFPSFRLVDEILHSARCLFLLSREEPIDAMRCGCSSLPASHSFPIPIPNSSRPSIDQFCLPKTVPQLHLLFCLDMIMASLMIRRLLQRSFSQTSFQRAPSFSTVQREIIQEDGKLLRRGWTGL